MGEGQGGEPSVQREDIHKEPRGPLLQDVPEIPKGRKGLSHHPVIAAGLAYSRCFTNFHFCNKFKKIWKTKIHAVKKPNLVMMLIRNISDLAECHLLLLTL